MKNSLYIYDHKLIYESEKKTFLKINSFKVMEKAAKTCFLFILKNFDVKTILILCGPGNNGGDGALIANYFLNKNIPTNVCYPFGFPKKSDSKKAMKLLSKKNIINKNILFENYTIIIDALFGTGFNRKFNKKELAFINKVNKSKTKIISIDMPSGVYTDNGLVNDLAIKSNITLSLQRFKPGQWLLPGKEYCGKTYLLNIGLVNLDKACSIQLNSYLPLKKLSLKEHKYSRGSCFIIAGKNMIGASKLAHLSASQSALRSGAGVCKLFVNKKNKVFFNPHILEEMLITYKDNKDFFSLFNNYKCNSLIFGCGINKNFANKEILIFLLKKNIKLVLDATFFSFFQDDKNLFLTLLNERKEATIMTPHEGEFNRVFNITNNKINDCIKAAKEFNSIIVYKGNDTVVGSPNGQAYINAESTPYLATAGSGDVLAGLIGGFLSQGIDPLKSARLGCYIHSQCGINLGPGLIAKDLINEIPYVIKKMLIND